MTLLQTNGLILDTERKTLMRVKPQKTQSQNHHTEINIAPLTWSVLYELIRQSPDVVSIDTLTQRCWQNTVVSDETVVQRIALLRKVLSEQGVTGNCIENRRGEGYRWLPNVEISPSEKADVNKRKIKYSTAAATIIILGVVVLLLTYQFQTVSEPQEVYPSQVQELVNQGHLYRRKFDSESMAYAIELYQQALRQAPDHIGALAGLSMAISQQISKFNIEQQSLDTAIKLAQKALVLAPGDAFVLQANGLAHDINGDIERAIDFYLRALEMNPDELSLHGDLAYLYTISGEFNKAFKYHWAGLSGSQQFRHSQLGLWLHLLGEPIYAGYWFEQASRLNPHNLMDKISIMDWQVKSGRFEQAILSAAEILADPSKKQGNAMFRIRLLKAQALILTGDKDAGTAMLLGSLEQEHQYIETLVWLKHYGSTGSSDGHQPSVPGLFDAIEHPWPVHNVWMAIYWHGMSKTIQSSQRQESAILIQNNDLKDHYSKTSFEHLTKAIETGYRDVGWLMILMDNDLLPNTPQINSLLKDVRQRVNRERRGLDLQPEFQTLMNNTARDILRMAESAKGISEPTS